MSFCTQRKSIKGPAGCNQQNARWNHYYVERGLAAPLWLDRRGNFGRSMTMLIPDHPPEELQILACLRSGERIEHYETRRSLTVNYHAPRLTFTILVT